MCHELAQQLLELATPAEIIAALPEKEALAAAH